jgi:integrase
MCFKNASIVLFFLLLTQTLFSQILGDDVGDGNSFMLSTTDGGATWSTQTLPFNDDALKLLGERTGLKERVFEGLKYSAWHNLKLQQWAMKAGISKTITFHCARHTYATLQLTLGTDIYTVSKLLGHKDLKTTQIYAKVIDERKTLAATKIKLDI